MIVYSLDLSSSGNGVTVDGTANTYVTGKAVAGALTIPSEGRRNMRLGRDIGLLDGAMDLAIVTDYDDEDAYRRWFGHPEHARVRADVLAPLIERGIV